MKGNTVITSVQIEHYIVRICLAIVIVVSIFLFVLGVNEIKKFCRGADYTDTLVAVMIIAPSPE